MKLHVKPNAYYDSVTLMLISRELKQLSGVHEALVGMGTDLNKEIACNIGLNSPDLEKCMVNDFFIAADCEDAVWELVLDKVEALLTAKKEINISAYQPATLETAVKMMPGLNMAIISVPGQYAAELAQDCLEREINVMLFSDNVPIEDERQLKEFARSKELLMMGPDCGTAIINHVPLAFANVVRPGNIGIVGASGTGTQEVSSLIDQLGCGVTQVIGTGGRDLKEEIGGLMFSLALDALIQDAATEIIVLISKPPSKEVQAKILAKAKAGGKPAVVCFIGGDPAVPVEMGLYGAVSLEDAARKAVALAKGETPDTFDGFDIGMDAARALAEQQVEQLASTQRYVRGLYTGGTLCDEAMKLMIGALGHIYSNIPLNPEDMLADKDVSVAHTCLDFGEDAFTVGRPHPMIDPSLRNVRIMQEMGDPQTAVILLDCVIGYGAHPDAAGELAQAITAARKGSGREVIVVASVCGTQSDPQGLAESRKALADANVLVFPSNAQAVRFTALVLDCMKG